MALIIFLLIIGIPVLELSVLIDVGGEIGALSTVALCLITAAIGLSLVRMQGMRIFQDMQAKAQAGEPVGENLIHGFFLLVSGIFLFIPGFITDFFGALLLLPFMRLMLGRAGMAQMVVRSNVRGNPFNRGPGSSDKDAANKDTHTHYSESITIIDGEFTSTEQDDPPADTPSKPSISPKKHTNDP